MPFIWDALEMLLDQFKYIFPENSDTYFVTRLSERIELRMFLFSQNLIINTTLVTLAKICYYLFISAQLITYFGLKCFTWKFKRFNLLIMKIYRLLLKNITQYNYDCLQNLFFSFQISKENYFIKEGYTGLLHR